MTFFYKFWKKARVYYTLSISRGGAQAPGPPPGFATDIVCEETELRGPPIVSEETGLRGPPI